MSTPALLILILAIALGLVLCLPLIAERRRRPMTDARRAEADGSFAILPGGLTYYRWTGLRSDRPMVVVHGQGASSWTFDALLRGLVRLNFHVLAYDIFGRGFSDDGKGGQDSAAMVAQLAALLDEQGIKAPVALLGHGMGGAVCAAFAAEHPDRVDRIILLAPAGLDRDPPALLRLALRAGPAGRWLWSLLGTRALRRWHRHPARIAGIEALGRKARAEASRRGLLRTMLRAERGILSQDMAPAHREIAAMYVPTLALWGEVDEVIPVSAIGRLSQANRQARHHVVGGAGHWLVHTHADEVLAQIAEFDGDFSG